MQSLDLEQKSNFPCYELESLKDKMTVLCIPHLPPSTLLIPSFTLPQCTLPHPPTIHSHINTLVFLQQKRVKKNGHKELAQKYILLTAIAGVLCACVCMCEQVNAYV